MDACAKGPQLYCSTCCIEFGKDVALPDALQLRLLDTAKPETALLQFSALTTLGGGGGATRFFVEPGLQRVRVACERGASGWDCIAIAVRPEVDAAACGSLQLVRRAINQLEEEPEEGIAAVVELEERLRQPPIASEAVALSEALQLTVVAQLTATPLLVAPFQVRRPPSQPRSSLCPCVARQHRS